MKLKNSDSKRSKQLHMESIAIATKYNEGMGQSGTATWKNSSIELLSWISTSTRIAVVNAV